MSPPTIISEINEYWVSINQSDPDIVKIQDLLGQVTPLIQNDTISDYNELLLVRQSVQFILNTTSNKESLKDEYGDVYKTILGQSKIILNLWYDDLKSRSDGILKTLKVLDQSIHENIKDENNIEEYIFIVKHFELNKQELTELIVCWGRVIHDHGKDYRGRREEETSNKSAEIYESILSLSLVTLEDLEFKYGDHLREIHNRKIISQVIITVLGLILLSTLGFLRIRNIRSGAKRGEQRNKSKIGSDSGETQIEDDKVSQRLDIIDNKLQDYGELLKRNGILSAELEKKNKELLERIRVEHGLNNQITNYRQRIKTLEEQLKQTKDKNFPKKEEKEVKLKGTVITQKESRNYSWDQQVSVKPNLRKGNLFYLKAPNQDGEFSTDTVERNSTEAYYELELQSNESVEGKIRINESNKEAIKRLTSRLDLWLTPVCDIQNPEDEETRDPETIEPGIARKFGDKWVVSEQEKIRMRYRTR